MHHAGLLGPEGTRLAELLSGSGVDLRYLKHTDVPQGHAVIQVQPDGQNCIFLYGGSNQAVTPQEIDEVLMQLNAGDYLLLQNEIANLTYLLRAAARRGLRVVLNASPISDELFKRRSFRRRLAGRERDRMRGHGGLRRCAGGL